MTHALLFRVEMGTAGSGRFGGFPAYRASAFGREVEPTLEQFNYLFPETHCLGMFQAEIKTAQHNVIILALLIFILGLE